MNLVFATNDVAPKGEKMASSKKNIYNFYSIFHAIHAIRKLSTNHMVSME